MGSMLPNISCAQSTGLHSNRAIRAKTIPMPNLLRSEHAGDCPKNPGLRSGFELEETLAIRTRGQQTQRRSPGANRENGP
jgi:hypothetical protein